MHRTYHSNYFFYRRYDYSITDILVRLQERSADYASFKMSSGSERERVYSQHANPRKPSVMRRTKPTATVDVEFAITRAKSRQTNHGPVHDYAMSFNRPPALAYSLHDVGVHFLPKSPFFIFDACF